MKISYRVDESVTVWRSSVVRGNKSMTGDLGVPRGGGGCAQESDNWQPKVTEGTIDIVQDKVNRHLLEC